MSDKDKVLLVGLIFGGVVLAAALFLYGNDIPILNPKGLIASKERRLIITATLLMLIVVLPVYALTFIIAWKYRASNPKATYKPDWDGHRGLETLWWAIPALIIMVLGIISWKSSHDLDPFKQLSSNVKPMTIEVIALQWKWLFIYPQQNIATVNYVQFPQATPVDFAITSDAPMNSFWIPQLGGQVYAMPGMTTHLHLIANEIGSYRGSSANISGEGFAGMKFTAKSTSRTDFNQWVHSVQGSSQVLSFSRYAQLAKPSQNNRPLYYSAPAKGLFGQTVSKYMHPSNFTAAVNTTGGL